MDRCYKLHGYPADYQNTHNKRHANVVHFSEGTTSTSFTPEQYKQLLNLIKQETEDIPQLHSQSDILHNALLAGTVCLSSKRNVT